MTRITRARMLLVEIEAIKTHKDGTTSLLILVNEVLKDAEKLAKEIVDEADAA